ncbi:MAG: DUF167 domain-containing protein [Candidatus Liptonbacteria bacterium]|nr:DUF167 domain-containing protein [Candidatus Liptonbacteria bacterium]
MKLFLKVKPSAKEARIEQTGENHFTVWVKEPAKENKANFAVLETVARHFGVGISRVRFVSGVKSKEKIVEISYNS